MTKNLNLAIGSDFSPDKFTCLILLLLFGGIKCVCVGGGGEEGRSRRFMICLSGIIVIMQ